MSAETEYLFGHGTKRHVAREPGGNVSRCGLILYTEDEMVERATWYDGPRASIDRKRAAAICRLCTRSDAALRGPVATPAGHALAFDAHGKPTKGHKR